MPEKKRVDGISKSQVFLGGFVVGAMISSILMMALIKKVRTTVRAHHKLTPMNDVISKLATP